jgi:hypothetical protein
MEAEDDESWFIEGRRSSQTLPFSAQTPFWGVNSMTVW